MKSSPNHRSLHALLAAFAFAGTSCGAIAENIAEEAVEQAVEADTGQDVEIDFDGGDDGATFTVETDEGTVQFDADDEGGTFTIDGSEDGDDGVIAFGDEADIPECFQGVLTMPSVEAQSMMSGDGFCTFMGVVTSGESSDELVNRYEAEIAAAGFTENSSKSQFSSDGLAQTSLSGTDSEGRYINVTIAEHDDYSFMDGSTGSATVINASMG
ncbi:MAG: hypothetical protein ACRBI6_21600 [Acidimicrobiales bacterium]